MKQSPSLKQVLKAVAGALIGLQSEQQRQQDFNSSRSDALHSGGYYCHCAVCADSAADC